MLNRDSKALKAVMAGAVAFTPVIAVGVNVEKASATTAKTDEEFRAYLKELYSTKTLQDPVNQGKLELAAKELERVFITEDKIGKILDPQISLENKTAAKEILEAFFTQLNPLVPVADFDKEFNDFKFEQQDNIRKIFGQDVTADEIAEFAAQVQSHYFTAILNTDNTSTEYYITQYAASLAANNQHEVYSGLTSILMNKDGVLVELEKLKTDTALMDQLKIALPILKQALTEVNKVPSLPPTGGFGGGGTTPTTEGGSITIPADSVDSNPQSVIDAINAAKEVSQLVLTVNGTEADVNIPVTVLHALIGKNAEANVVVKITGASYSIPVSVIEVDAAAKTLGVTTVELKLNVEVKPVTTKAKNHKQLTGAYDYKLELVAPNGKTVELKNFKRPVTRGIEAASKLNSAITLGVVVQADGSVVAVPTYVDGDKNALLRRNTNSTYTLIEYSKTFKDVDKGASWAEPYVEKLASKMVVKGISDTQYSPTKTITRGEFAAILARGLGLVASDVNADDFKDVSSSQGFNKNGEIAAVVEAGLVKGFGNNTFRPNEEITRDQAAIMISRAIDYIDSNEVKLDAKKKAASFKDYSKIGVASRPHVDKVYKAGYLDGYTDGTFRPGADTNRAQMAKILYNFLNDIKFIN